MIVIKSEPLGAIPRAVHGYFSGARCRQYATPWCIRTAAAALLALGAGLGTAQAQDTAQVLPRVQLTSGMHLIQAEVAAAPRQREIGLMYRKSMPANAGMLFVFEDKAVHCFWMKNTLLPLSIAFLADDGRIVNIADMEPETEVSHCPKEPVRYALEMNQGWFAKRGQASGGKIVGTPFAGR
jgi:uncharacterized membrane protein (UPF0127 family)